MRGTGRKAAHTAINVELLLVCLAHIARHGGVALPELLKVAKAAGMPVSRPTLNRLLTDAIHHLGVRVLWRADPRMPSRGEYWIQDWGVLDSRKVLAHVGETGINGTAPASSEGRHTPLGEHRIGLQPGKQGKQQDQGCNQQN
jgi:hypothetical protein